MRKNLLLTLITSMSIAILSSCESELDEVTPITTIDVTKEKLADTNGLKTKIFFPKDPIKK